MRKQQVCINSQLDHFTFGNTYVEMNGNEVNIEIPDFMIVVHNDLGEPDVVYPWDFVPAEEYTLLPRSYYEAKDRKRIEEKTAPRRSRTKWWKFW